MMIILAFFGGIFVMQLSGAIGYYVASFWLEARESKIAGFAFAFGSMGASNKSADAEICAAVGLGALCGLALLWWFFFKRVRHNA